MVIINGMAKQQFNPSLGKTILQQYNVTENISIEMDVSSR